MSLPTLLRSLLLLAASAFLALGAQAQTGPVDYPLAAGDTVRVQVFQNPDLTLETRITESGLISFPLIGSIRLGGLPVSAAEKKIADALKSGGFLQNPQVTLLLTQIRGSQVSVLGQVGRPGRFPLETASTRLSDMLANAGGTAPSGDDVVIVSGQRAGKPFRKLVDLPALFLRERSDDDIVLQGGDVIYVHRAPVFYVYGEAQRPGSFRIERSMTVMQALALAGGPTARGSRDRLQLHRQQDDGSVKLLAPQMNDLVLPNDVLYVRESLF
ncbi:polysaccharide export protein EpsE [Hydrogenophaga sp. PBL-H3]|uniref:polysaccharide export protein EpsE n=1 Tax=Hydrogenophaga sp. PBL-H3 TaxID=434010 RepID=UPI0013202A81|nr:polysaccharide export protein EpsE [Hydrogenophaga sp. PBL-H3]QHE75935.1 polysaccharide export protein EpsE [Hydrogenophaga sp. PBL-H3]QHE80359.1 polysaccharide export protein EpsE [Hydrogenophaga sp. PBL-H3]